MQRGGVEFCVAKVWHLNYALRNDVIDFGHLVQVSHFDLRLIITRIALGGCIPRRILCRFLEGKMLVRFLTCVGEGASYPGGEEAANVVGNARFSE